MKSQFILMKVKNIINTHKNSRGMIVTTTCIFIITFLAFTSIALALTLKNKERKNPSCPQTIIGKWKPDKLNTQNNRTINIQKNEIIIIGYHNPTNTFHNNIKSYQVGNKVIKFSVDKINQIKLFNKLNLI
jgi:hypothetical protein